MSQSTLKATVMGSFNCHIDINQTWEENAVEELPRSGWPVGMSMGIVLIAD